MSSKTIKNVIVVGATGALGPAVIKSLLEHSFVVSVLTRSASSSQTKLLPTASKVEIIETDYSPSSLLSAFKNQDAVISTIGAVATMRQVDIIDAAVKAGVKRFIPSHFAPTGTPETDSEMETTLPELWARLKPKTAVLAYLSSAAQKAEGFEWSAVRCGPVFDITLKNALLGINPLTHKAVITGSGNELYNSTTSSLLSLAISRLLSLPTGSPILNRVCVVNSFTTTQNQVLAACEAVTGEMLEVERVGSQERKKDGIELLKAGNFRGIGNLWNFWCHGDGNGGRHLVKEEECANEELDLEREDLEGVVRSVVG